MYKKEWNSFQPDIWHDIRLCGKPDIRYLAKLLAGYPDNPSTKLLFFSFFGSTADILSLFIMEKQINAPLN